MMGRHAVIAALVVLTLAESTAAGVTHCTNFRRRLQQQPRHQPPMSDFAPEEALPWHAPAWGPHHDRDAAPMTHTTHIKSFQGCTIVNLTPAPGAQRHYQLTTCKDVPAGTLMLDLQNGAEPISSIAADAFVAPNGHLNSLQTLCIAGSIGAIPAGVFDPLPALTELKLMAASWGGPADSTVFGNMPALEVLDLRGNGNLRAIPDRAFPPTLTTLDLGATALTRVPGRELAYLPSLTRLQLDSMLRLQGHGKPPTFGSVNDGDLPLPKLQWLDLGTNPQLTSLSSAALRSLALLKYLYLGNTGLTAVPSMAFFGLEKVETIDLLGCKHLRLFAIDAFPGPQEGLLPRLEQVSVNDEDPFTYQCDPGVCRARVQVGYSFTLGKPITLPTCTVFADEPGWYRNTSTTCARAACQPGSYCGPNATVAEPCPAGRYGDVRHLTNASCTGACTPAHFCPAGTVTPTQWPAGLCSPGRWGARGSGDDMCTGPCAPGRWGGAGNVQSSCSGPCAAGRFGIGGSTGAACNGPCAPGHLCPEGSTTATAAPCPAGSFCPVTGTGTGSGTHAQPCAVGRYSGVANASVEGTCTPCAAGHFCPDPGMSAPRPCPVGTFSPYEGLSAEHACALCPDGTSTVADGATTEALCMSTGPGSPLVTVEGLVLTVAVLAAVWALLRLVSRYQTRALRKRAVLDALGVPRRRDYTALLAAALSLYHLIADLYFLQQRLVGADTSASTATHRDPESSSSSSASDVLVTAFGVATGLSLVVSVAWMALVVRSEARENPLFRAWAARDHPRIAAAVIVLSCLTGKVKSLEVLSCGAFGASPFEAPLRRATVLRARRFSNTVSVWEDAPQLLCSVVLAALQGNLWHLDVISTIACGSLSLMLQVVMALLLRMGPGGAAAAAAAALGDDSDGGGGKTPHEAGTGSRRADDGGDNAAYAAAHSVEAGGRRAGVLIETGSVPLLARGVSGSEATDVGSAVHSGARTNSGPGGGGGGGWGQSESGPVSDAEALHTDRALAALSREDRQLALVLLRQHHSS